MPTTTPQSMALSQTGRRLLEIAADRPGHSLLPFPPEVPVRGAVRQRLLAGLLRAGFVEEVAAAEPPSTWRTDETGRGITLRLTGQGFAAIGRTPPAGKGRARQRRTATAAGGAAHDRSSVPLVGKAPASASGGAAGQEPGGKLGGVLAALSTDAGATLSELVALTGWQPHTTRAALTRLRQRGYTLERTERDGGKAYRIGGRR
jgi:hypothetical protein